jgi:2,3-dihydroxybiphenyl 1,2-dioxygenase
MGVAQLGYLGFEVKDLARWESFATEVLGLVVGRRDADGGFGLRMDSREQRFFVTPGAADDVSVIGWEVADEASLEALAGKLRESGVTVTAGSEEEAARRRVRRLFKLVDPAGTPTEIFCGPALAKEPFASPVVRSGFVADDLGLGHVVVSAHDHEQSVAFYSQLLGFKLSDRITCEFYGFPVDIEFFHVNERHHTVAVGARQRKRIHHFMIEARSMDEVGLAFDRALNNGVRIQQTLGRHPNDRMFSFYARTPSGFEFEFGWGGRRVDDATWETTTYDRISEWGHHPPEIMAARATGKPATGKPPAPEPVKEKTHEGSARGEVR